MSESDIMISDFSGITFEYAFTFKKPVITFNQQINLEMYDASDLDHLTWKYDAFEKIGRRMDVSDIQDLPHTIDELLKSDMTHQIQTVADTYWKEQGKCAQNIVNYLEMRLKQIND